MILTKTLLAIGKPLTVCASVEDTTKWMNYCSLKKSDIVLKIVDVINFCRADFESSRANLIVNLSKRDSRESFDEKELKNFVSFFLKKVSIENEVWKVEARQIDDYNTLLVIYRR
jgi:hypothetical protein